MAVQRASKGKIPEGAVILSESDVENYHYRLIKEWKPMRDVWPFHLGHGFLGSAAAITGTYCNVHYRKKLLLGHFGRISTFFPMAFIPAVSCLIFHQAFVTSEILKLKNVCPVCIELRAAGIQVAMSTLFPLILGPLSCFTVALQKYTYDVPSIVKEPKAVFKLWQKFTSPKANVFLGFALANAGLAVLITHLKAKSLYNIEMEIMKSSEDKLV